MKIPCPNCERLCQLDAVTVVHPDTSELDALLRGDLNCAYCEECEHPILYETPILYRDDNARLMVYFIPVSHCPSLEEALAQLETLYADIFAEVHANDRPDCRLVTTRQRFIEKIALFRAGYNDRLVEYVKYMLFEHNPGLQPGRHELLYDFARDNDDTLVFQAFDNSIHEHVYTVEFQMDDYFNLEEHYLTDDDARNQLDDLFPTHHVQVCELFEAAEA